MAIIATNARVEVENTLGTATAITALTLANPGVATSTTHGLTTGDVVKLAVTDGTVEVDEQVVRVNVLTVDTFELEGIDTTGYGTWSSGTFQEVTGWYTLSAATSVNLSDAAPTELDGTRLIDKRAVTLYGLPGSISGTIDIQHDPSSSSVQKIKAAGTDDLLAFRVTWNDGSLAIFGAKTAYSGGFSAGVNNILTGSIAVTVPSDIVEYTS